ncbi:MULTISPECIES: helix-turn-helix domain-containing protein [Gammaproteobacteria]|uniref:helix-turn-helix domain-containing protein n=1 Tax=Gammaproteobacteria TaxID=1236 RepID=UPI003A94F812
MSVSDDKTADRLIGSRIQQRRKELSLTAAALAEKLGISQQQLSRYERGESKISLSMMVKVATLLTSSLEWFTMDCTDDTQLITLSSEPLKLRLLQCWDKLDDRKRRALLRFLDEII